VVKGELTGEIITVGGNVMVSGTVHGDIVAVGGKIHVTNGAQVDKEAVAIGGLITTEGNVIARRGSDFVSLPWMHLPGQLSVGWRGALALLGFHVVCVLLPVGLLRPKRVKNVAAASKHWIITALLGAATLAVFSEILELVDDHAGDSAETVEQIVGVLFLAVLALGIAGVALTIGEWFISERLFAALAMGCLLLVGLELIPYFGFAVMISGSCWATGAALWSGMGFRGPRTPRDKEAPPVLKLIS